MIKRLADAADVYRIDPARRFGVCRPNAADFQMLERALAFKDPTASRQLFEAWSVAAKSVRIDSWRAHFDTEVLSISRARGALTTAIHNPNDVARRPR